MMRGRRNERGGMEKLLAVPSPHNTWVLREPLVIKKVSKG